MTNTIIDSYDYSGKPATRIIKLAETLTGQDNEIIKLDELDRNALKENFTLRNSDGEVIEL
jgi:hypothetical protein